MDYLVIVCVFDVGMSLQGRFFFVMEFVKGVLIDDYCDCCCLMNDECFVFFMQVCVGVQYVYQKVVIYCDFKLFNIFVYEEDGQVKVKIIDFGIVKVIVQWFIEKLLFIGFGVLFGMLNYMSLEQVDFFVQDVDICIDVYLFGVVFYEFLVGVLVFFKEMLCLVGFDEMC